MRRTWCLFATTLACSGAEDSGPSFSTTPEETGETATLAIVSPESAVDPWLLSDDVIEVVLDGADGSATCSWEASNGDSGEFERSGATHRVWIAADGSDRPTLTEAVQDEAEAEQSMLTVTCTDGDVSDEVLVRLRGSAHQQDTCSGS